jgi:hypothetical protein
MKGSDKRWEQHREQDHREYQDWKDHHITYISSAKRMGASAFSKAHATLRGSRPVWGESSGGNNVTRSVPFCSVWACPPIGASALCPKFVATHRCIGDTKAFRSLTTTA